jgi:DNA mismatch endonuclease (patch repair protein)
VADIVDTATRSRMMAGIRSANTRPEIAIRSALHAKGFRYRLHPRNLPGKPDMAFPRYRTALFVNGCFWHGHDCHLFRVPGTRTDFWSGKIQRNRERDAVVRQQLQAQGWRVLTIWECAIRGREAKGLPRVVAEAAKWLKSAETVCDIRGGASGAR